MTHERPRPDAPVGSWMRRRTRRMRRAGLFAAVVTLLGAGLAQPATETAPAAQPVPTTADLGAFFDGLMPAQLEAHRVPGAVVTVVRDGQIVFARGYGYADVDARAPVDPDTTLFRIGSVTKLFTYTAAMQLVESGELDLDVDVNTYLDAPLVPAAYGEPVTAAHLMTHTAGFQEDFDGLFARDAEAMEPLGDVLERTLPLRVRPPGELAGYSNHGVGLLGYVVERISGRSYATYLEEEILGPLDMRATTARQPLPAALEGDMSGGYAYVGGVPRAQPFTFVPLAPAGAVAASGTDMARFMIAHLQDGLLDGARILEDDTSERMKSRLFGHDPRIAGMAHGFYESRIMGEPTLGHDGGMPNFISRLMLFPERNVGVFVSYNSAGGALAQEVLARAFVERYFPHAPPSPADHDVPSAQLNEIAGSYLSTRSVQVGDGRLMNLFMTMNVAAGGDGGLRITSLAQPPMTVAPVEPGLWRDPDTRQRVVTDARDGRRVLFVENAPVLAFQQVPWHARPGLHAIVFAVSVVLLLSVVAVAPFTAVLHRRLRDRPSALHRWGRAVLVVAALLLLAFVVALGSALVNVQEVTFGVPRAVEVLGALLPVAAVLVAIALVLTPIAWARGVWSRAGRVHYLLGALAGLALVVQAMYWHLLTLPGIGAA